MWSLSKLFLGAAGNVREARKLLARSLLFLEWACKQIYGEWYGQAFRCMHGNNASEGIASQA